MELTEFCGYRLYDSVKIKPKNITGVIVSIDSHDQAQPPIFVVEVDDEYKTGNFQDDILWLNYRDVEK